MFNLLQVVNLRTSEGVSAARSLVARLSQLGDSLPGVRGNHAGLTLPRALNGGQAMWRLSFGSEADYWACMASTRWRGEVSDTLTAQYGLTLDKLAYRVDFSATAPARASPGIWRCLVMAMNAQASAEKVRQLQRDLLLMPRHIPAIRNWALGQVVWSQGRRSWRLIWEQEFDDVRALEEDYMVHPIHWGLVDSWFDPECPQRIVDPFLVHAAFAIDNTAIR